MYGLNNSSGIPVMPALAEKLTENPLWFTEGGNGVEPSWPGADWFNMYQAELLNLLAIAGIEPSIESLTQIAESVSAIAENSKQSIKDELASAFGAALSLSQIAVNYGLSFSDGGTWTSGESLALGKWRYYQNQIWMPNSSGVICGDTPDYTNFHRTKPWLLPNEIALSCFGIVTDGMDITAVLSRAITYAKLNGWMTIVDDVYGTKYITGMLPQMNNSFDTVKLRSINRLKCVLDFTAAPNGAMSWIGGSGGIAGDVIFDITIYAGYSKSPIMFKGFGGPVIRRSHIIADVAAFLSNDVGIGTFTEFVRFIDCDIHCNSIFMMYRGAGNDSFHGCGWGGCVINVNGGRPYLIALGANLSETVDTTGRLVLYNSNISGSVFSSTFAGLEIVKIFTNVGTELASLAGQLNLELGTTVKFSASGRVFFCGAVTAIGGRFIFGNATHAEKVESVKFSV